MLRWPAKISSRADRQRRCRPACWRGSFRLKYFALDPAGGFRLAAIKNSTKPGKDCSKSHQQARQHGHVANQIMHRFVSDGFGLSDYNGPSGRLDWTERIEIAGELEVSISSFADLSRHNRFRP